MRTVYIANDKISECTKLFLICSDLNISVIILLSIFEGRIYVFYIFEKIYISVIYIYIYIYIYTYIYTPTHKGLRVLYFRFTGIYVINVFVFSRHRLSLLQWMLKMVFPNFSFFIKKFETWNGESIFQEGAQHWPRTLNSSLQCNCQFITHWILVVVIQ